MHIKRSTVDKHRKKCLLEKVCYPFEKVGCIAKGLRRKDEAEHMEKNVVNHQLLMLKSWDQRAAVIAKSVDSLLATCTKEQRFPLQSICSVIDDSYCLTLDGAALSLEMTNFSKYKQNNQVWYSPPFYLGDITGLKLRLAVYPNGIKEGAGTHVSLVVECLERDLKEPKEFWMKCEYVQVQAIGTSAAENISNGDDGMMCECQNIADIAANKRLHYNYKFMSHDVAQKIM